MQTRTERDALGERAVPADAYYGIQTARAMENFPISGLRAHPALIVATTQVKLAAAQANVALGRLSPTIGNAIAAAAREIIGGRWHEQFPGGRVPGGRGDLPQHERQRGARQPGRWNSSGSRAAGTPWSTPTTTSTWRSPPTMSSPPPCGWPPWPGCIRCSRPWTGWRAPSGSAARAFDGVIKAGRTHLQDATPIRLGQEFGGYATAIAAHLATIGEARADAPVARAGRNGGGHRAERPPGLPARW